MSKRIERIKERIIHRLGGITPAEIPPKTRLQTRYVNVKPERISAVCIYNVTPDLNAGLAETCAKKDVLTKIIEEIDEAGLVRYTNSTLDTYETDIKIIRKAVRADLWVVKAP